MVEDTACKLGDKGEKVVQNMTQRAKEMEDMRGQETWEQNKKVLEGLPQSSKNPRRRE